MITTEHREHSIPLWLSGNRMDDEAPSSRRRGSAHAGVHSLRILIVEDEPFIALDMQDVVEELGHSVIGIANSADQAVQLVEHEKPDVVLMDIRLSGTRDGIEAAKEISDRFAVPSVFVSANADAQTRSRAKTVGCLGFLEKPVNPQRLASVLRKAEA